MKKARGISFDALLSSACWLPHSAWHSLKELAMFLGLHRTQKGACFSGVRAICFCLVLLGIGFVVSRGVERAGTASVSVVSNATVGIEAHPSREGSPGTFRGEVKGQPPLPPPIPETGLPHCVLFTILGNDFDPCNWMMRAVVAGANWFLEWIKTTLQGFVDGLLSHDILFDTPTSVTTNNDAVIALVNDMRWIANSALILITIIGGFNIMIRPHVGLSYHGVAEFFPRYALGAIGANLSLWAIGQLVDASNLFMHFVGIAPLFTPQLTNLPTGANVAADIFFGTIGVILYDLMLLLLILQIFLRLALLDLLIVISPLAIICWILPQTQRAAEWWAGMLSSTLVLQPLQLTVISMGVTLAINIPLKDGIWGFDTVLFQLFLLIATFYLCFRLPALLNYGLFRSIGGVKSGFGIIIAAAQLGIGLASGNQAAAMGATGSGGGGTTVTPIAPLSASVGSGAQGLTAPAGTTSSGFGGALPGPSGTGTSGGNGSPDSFGEGGTTSTSSGYGGGGNADTGTSLGNTSSNVGWDGGAAPPDLPGNGRIIEGSGYSIFDDGGPLR